MRKKIRDEIQRDLSTLRAENENFGLPWENQNIPFEVTPIVLMWQACVSVRYHSEYRRGADSDLLLKIADTLDLCALTIERIKVGLNRVSTYQALLSLAEHERDLLIKAPTAQIIELICSDEPAKIARRLYWCHVLPIRWKRKKEVSSINKYILPWEQQ